MLHVYLFAQKTHQVGAIIIYFFINEETEAVRGYITEASFMAS